ncbi:alpha/beta hydrolase [Arachnia propionica]|jgi:hypothetical protein|uniref:Serine aminopeptidase S33 domain-containing protein n=1 Tax=Arachnia propionica TaxID=1750 RepID=A0A3S4VK18_9ACTN|nr:alpha/beta hydrolase [Arachnia propionica]VEH70850.1 Uncharacterised protein [Arachnia propionica]
MIESLPVHSSGFSQTRTVGRRRWGGFGTVIAFAEKAYPGVPLLLLGHSTGSIMACCYAIENSQHLAGLAFTGMNATPGLSG